MNYFKIYMYKKEKDSFHAFDTVFSMLYSTILYTIDT